MEKIAYVHLAWKADNYERFSTQSVYFFLYLYILGSISWWKDLICKILAHILSSKVNWRFNKSFLLQRRVKSQPFPSIFLRWAVWRYFGFVECLLEVFGLFEFIISLNIAFNFSQHFLNIIVSESSIVGHLDPCLDVIEVLKILIRGVYLWSIF